MFHRRFPADWLKAAAVNGPQRSLQTDGVFVPRVALCALWTELAFAEWESLPRLESDNLVVADAQLDAAWLAAESTMCFDQLFLLLISDPTSGRHCIKMWPKLRDNLRNAVGSFAIDQASVNQ